MFPCSLLPVNDSLPWCMPPLLTLQPPWQAIHFSSSASTNSMPPHYIPFTLLLSLNLHFHVPASSTLDRPPTSWELTSNPSPVFPSLSLFLYETPPPVHTRPHKHLSIFLPSGPVLFLNFLSNLKPNFYHTLLGDFTSNICLLNSLYSLMRMISDVSGPSRKPDTEKASMLQWFLLS